MSPRVFKGSFTQQEPLPEAAIEAAVDVLRTGRLHRYNTLDGEPSVVARLERAFADWQGAEYCLATTSGGQAMQIALRAAGVAPGDPVLTNAFTLAPVPGAIAAVGAKPVFVETNESLRIDPEDLGRKIKASGARHLLLSHMRGHLCDMDKLMSICDAASVAVIEDCAHTMGAKWRGRRSGNFGVAGCFSTQTYKHINAGEGGLLISDDPLFIARAIVLSGSYMLYERHGAAPSSEYFASARLDMPNMSARMDNLRAAILLPQLDTLEINIQRWNDLYGAVEHVLRKRNEIVCISRPDGESKVGSSIQFRLPDYTSADCLAFLERTKARGIDLKWFGADEPHGFTSTHRTWRYARSQSLPRSDAIFATLFDMRLPLTFTVEDCKTIGGILGDCLARG